MKSLAFAPKATRRLVRAALASLMFASLAATAAPAQVKEQVPGFYRQQVGDVVVTALYDGYVDIGSKLLKGMQAKDLQSLMARMFVVDKNGVQTAVNGFLVHTQDKLVLVDAGAAQCFGPTMGGLVNNIRAAGYKPEDVDAVLLTHLHPDHACGLTQGTTAVFPNATVWASQKDADYWLSNAAAQQAPEDKKPFFKMAQDAVAPYKAKGALHTYADGAQPLPGFSVLGTPGHTPGHSSYLVTSKGQTLLLWGDIVHSHSVQMAHPEVSIEFDSDQQQAIKTRKAVFAQAAAKGWLIAGAHMPFPGLGHIRKDARGYSWVPVEYGPVRADR